MLLAISGLHAGSVLCSGRKQEQPQILQWMYRTLSASAGDANTVGRHSMHVVERGTATHRRLRALVSRTSQGLSCSVTATSSMTCASACGRERTRTTASAPLQSGSMPMTSSGLSPAD